MIHGIIVPANCLSSLPPPALPSNLPRDAQQLSSSAAQQCPPILYDSLHQGNRKICSGKDVHGDRPSSIHLILARLDPLGINCHAGSLGQAGTGDDDTQCPHRMRVQDHYPR